jgi:preprotein translocase subunit SecA
VYAQREEEVGPEAMRNLERRVLLSVIGRKWPEHLYEMDYLKEGIGLRAMAQRDPLVEYQREGYAMFQEMMGAIREETVSTLFRMEVRRQRVGAGGGPVDLRIPRQPRFLQYTAPGETGGTQTRVEPAPAAPDGEAPAEGSGGAEPGADETAVAETSPNRAGRRARARVAGAESAEG